MVGDGFAAAPPADALVHDGDVLHTRSGDWVVGAAPGHSPSQLMLHDPARGWPLTVDAAYTGIRPFIEWGFSPTRLRSTGRRSTGWKRSRRRL